MLKGSELSGAEQGCFKLEVLLIRDRYLKWSMGTLPNDEKVLSLIPNMQVTEQQTSGTFVIGGTTNDWKKIVFLVQSNQTTTVYEDEFERYSLTAKNVRIETDLDTTPPVSMLRLGFAFNYADKKRPSRSLGANLDPWRQPLGQYKFLGGSFARKEKEEDR